MLLLFESVFTRPGIISTVCVSLEYLNVFSVNWSSSYPPWLQSLSVCAGLLEAWTDAAEAPPLGESRCSGPLHRFEPQTSVPSKWCHPGGEAAAPLLPPRGQSESSAWLKSKEASSRIPRLSPWAATPPGLFQWSSQRQDAPPAAACSSPWSKSYAGRPLWTPQYLQRANSMTKCYV